ncbi:hypothetical protein ACLBWT_11100 [Paenibacillus sp. D51F]
MRGFLRSSLCLIAIMTDLLRFAEQPHRHLVVGFHPVCSLPPFSSFASTELVFVEIGPFPATGLFVSSSSKFDPRN